MEAEENEYLTDSEKITRAQRVIDAHLPSELHSRFKLAMQRFCMFWPKPGADYRLDLSPETLRRCTVLFKSYSSFGDDFKISHSIMTDSCQMFGFRDSEQIFISADPYVQKRWLKASPISNSVAMYAHLKMSKEIGVISAYHLSGVDFSRVGAKSQIADFLKELEEDSIASGLSEGLDFSEPTEEFMESLRYARTALRSFGIRKEEMQVFLRVVYGETAYLEVMDRIFNELLEVTPVQILDMFDNWEEWHVFPSEWIREMLNNESPLGNPRYSV